MFQHSALVISSFAQHSLFTRHSSLVTHHSSLFTHPSSLLIHASLVTRHCLFTRHSSLITRHLVLDHLLLSKVENCCNGKSEFFEDAVGVLAESRPSLFLWRRCLT